MVWVVRRKYCHAPNEFFYMGQFATITMRLGEATLYEKSVADGVAWYMSYGGSDGWRVVEYDIAIIEDVMRS